MNYQIKDHTGKTSRFIYIGDKDPRESNGNQLRWTVYCTIVSFVAGLVWGGVLF